MTERTKKPPKSEASRPGMLYISAPCEGVRVLRKFGSSHRKLKYPASFDSTEGASPKGGCSLRFYETTIVLSPQADDATIEREIEKVTKTVTDAKGKLVTTQKWGVKRLAYPIMDHAQAYYIHFVYQSPPSVPGSLESMFRINEDILRHLTILVDGPLASTRAAEMAAAHAKPAYRSDSSTTMPPKVEASVKAPAKAVETPVVAETVGAPDKDDSTVPASDQGKPSESSE